MNVYFVHGETRLRPQAKAALDELAGQMKDLNAQVVIAVGHADTRASAAAAQRISDERAQAVKDYLASSGVDENRIYTEGRGNREPVATNNTPGAQARNNRVEVEVVGTRAATEGNEPWKPNDLVPVLFATNRKHTGNDNPLHFYGNEISDEPDLDNLQYGIATVRVPPNRQRGEVKKPGWVTMTINRLPPALLGLAPKVPGLTVPDSMTEFSFEEKIVELTESDFASTLKSAVGQAKGKSAVLYVHGYNDDFADAAFRTAQIAYDLATPVYEVVPIMFSWPSNPGRTGGASYEDAQKRSEISGYELATFLKIIADTTDIGTVHIIAHSMGAQVLGRAMMKLGVAGMGTPTKEGMKPRFRQIVFAAPDITPQIFRQLIEPAIRTGHTITNYISSRDVAIWVSTVENKGARVGNNFQRERLVQCVDTIDVSSEATFGLSHSTWAESSRVLDDLRQVLENNLAPWARGLKKRLMARRVIWSMEKDPSGASSPGPAPTSRQIQPCELTQLR
jgi:esterase/lipase superfamily enzyme